MIYALLHKEADAGGVCLLRQKINVTQKWSYAGDMTPRTKVHSRKSRASDCMFPGTTGLGT